MMIRQMLIAVALTSSVSFAADDASGWSCPYRALKEAMTGKAKDGSTAPSPDQVDEKGRITRSELEAHLRTIQERVTNSRFGVNGPNSMTWKITRENAVLAGSAAAVLLQLAHPHIAHAIDQHSSFKKDPVGRGQKTALFGTSMGFGDLDTAFRSARAVYNIHSKVKGILPEAAGRFAAGSSYAANMPDSMFWVIATLVETSIKSYTTYVGPLTENEIERYYQESRDFGGLFGIPDEAMPKNYQEFRVYMDRMLNSDVLAVTPTSRALSKILFDPKNFKLPMGGVMGSLELLTSELLPPRLAEGFGLPNPRTTTNQAKLKVMKKAAKAAYRVLPSTLRYSPAYLMAMHRINGTKPSVAELKLYEAVTGRKDNPFERGRHLPKECEEALDPTPGERAE